MPTQSSIFPLRRTSDQTPNGIKAKPGILLVDDSEAFRTALDPRLKMNRFEVVAAANATRRLSSSANKPLTSCSALYTLPRLGDGLPAVSAMRHSNVQAIPLLFTAYPEMKRAAEVILLQADDFLKTNQAPRGFQ